MLQFDIQIRFFYLEISKYLENYFSDIKVLIKLDSLEESNSMMLKIYPRSGREVIVNLNFKLDSHQGRAVSSGQYWIYISRQSGCEGSRVVWNAIIPLIILNFYSNIYKINHSNSDVVSLKLATARLWKFYMVNKKSLQFS